MSAIHHTIARNNLPYDTRIEYLESSKDDFSNLAMEYINTDIVVSIDSVIEGWFYRYSNETGPWANFFGVQSKDDSNDQFSSRIYDHDTATINCWVVSSVANASIPVDKKFYLSVSKDKISIDGTVTALPSVSGSVHNRPLYLFCSNWNGTPRRQSHSRCYGFRINNNGIRVLDLIPVRVGNIGYMYDKVTGKLFGNKGKGAFILGADL